MSFALDDARNFGVYFESKYAGILINAVFKPPYLIKRSMHVNAFLDSLCFTSANDILN